jgi:uncharacterized protein YndB with AHSA1/START domain
MTIEVTAFRWVPPFAQGLVRDLRVRWALEEAGLAYEARLIDHANRSELPEPPTASTEETISREYHPMSNTTNTVRLHRVLRAPAERLYRAFLDPDAMVKWLPPHGFTAKVHAMDARVGGSHRMSFTNFTTGQSHSFGGKYVELTPHERIRYTDKFDDPDMPGEMQVTIALRKVDCGTELEIVQEGLPSVIPVENCYLGWQESLSLLAHLVEAEIRE